MRPAALDPVIQHTANASQALYDCRQKGSCTQQESEFLEPIQTELAELLEVLRGIRQFLENSPNRN